MKKLIEICHYGPYTAQQDRDKKINNINREPADPATKKYLLEKLNIRPLTRRTEVYILGKLVFRSKL